MYLQVYIFIVLIVLFIVHFKIKESEIRKYQEILNNRDDLEYLEKRTFTVIDKYEISNIKRFSPPSYYIKLKSNYKKEIYEEDLKVSYGTYLKTKIGDKNVYKLYQKYGSNEILLINQSNKSGYYFDEINVLITLEYVVLAIMACLIVSFLFIALLL